MLDNTAHAPRPQHGEAIIDRSRTCMIRLVDRRTGAPLRLNGSVLRVFTRDPRAAVAELLEGRDPALWEARVDILRTARA
ncbi:hypothetical protein [Rhodovulum strictum]|uniref:Uncharacterized protein n=1 Tax=Rhodovulum strictum TaxID=58314 RepID=A0A844B5A6_9RHOB|nr:hypothetical protein [Rhodovulum strictum]MRH21381.1 hypothetical protein [Rhodovulum strictum]